MINTGDGNVIPGFDSRQLVGDVLHFLLLVVYSFGFEKLSKADSTFVMDVNCFQYSIVLFSSLCLFIFECHFQGFASSLSVCKNTNS